MYTLRFPFELRPPYEMVDQHSFQLDGVQVNLSQEGDVQLLKIAGFPNRHAAEAFMARVRTGLASLLLNSDLAVNAAFELQEVFMADDPAQAAKNLSKTFGGAEFGDRIDGVIDGRRPAIYPSDRQFSRVTGGKVSVQVTSHAADVAASIEHGMRAVTPFAIEDDTRLQTAMELYGAAQTEITARARFITHMMVLEALAEPTRRPAAVQSFLDSVHEALKAQRDEHDEASEEALAFDALQREIFFRRDNSIRNQLRQLVLKILADKEAAKHALHLYDRRSALVHDGTLPEQELGQLVSDAKKLTRRVLGVRYAETVGLPAAPDECD